jgi:hypothetical protein
MRPAPPEGGRFDADRDRGQALIRGTVFVAPVDVALGGEDEALELLLVTTCVFVCADPGGGRIARGARRRMIT